MRALPLALLILLAPLPALAHPGHGAETGFASGILHPILGPDHLLAMLAVGLWAALTGGRAMWAYPATFVAAMLAGGLLGTGGSEWPVVEPAILASVVVIGAAAALMLRVPVWAAVPALALFGLAHGHAHGVEGPGGLDYALGFVIATLALHGAGLAIGLLLGQRQMVATARGLGAMVAAAGLWLVLAPEAEAVAVEPVAAAAHSHSHSHSHGHGHSHSHSHDHAAPGDIPDDVARWIELGTQVHGGFGSLIALGVQMGLDGAEAVGAPGRFQLEVRYQSSADARCPCVIDGLQAATRTSLGQRTLVLDPTPPPADAFGVATFRNRETGAVWRATIPMTAWPLLRDANDGTTPAERWSIIAAAEGLYTLEQQEPAQ